MKLNEAGISDLKLLRISALLNIIKWKKNSDSKVINIYR
jgi:hypothetical protein